MKKKCPGFGIGLLLLALSIQSHAQCILIGPGSGKTCLYNSVCFTCTAPVSCTPTTYEWDWGDGIVTLNGSGQACHIYSTKGIFTVTCCVKCSNGNKTCCTSVINARPAPKADFIIDTPNFQCVEGNEFHIIDQSDSSGATIVQRRLLYGDGSFDITTGYPSKPIDIWHRYANYIGGFDALPHKYTITLEVSDSNGCVSAKQKTVTLGGQLDVKVKSSYIIGLDSTSVHLTNLSSDMMYQWATRPGRLRSFTWNFGDGNSYTGFSVNDPKWLDLIHVYKNKMGPFDVRLTVIDSDSCTGTYLLKNGGDNIYFPDDFSVYNGSTWSDSASSCFRGNRFQFKVTKPFHPSYMFKSKFDFDDPNNGVENIYPHLPEDTVLWSYPHSFSDCGIYHPGITVFIYDSSGSVLMFTKSKQVKVKILGPHATIQNPAKGICVRNRISCHIKDTVYFTNISTYCQPGTSPVKRTWDFDDVANASPCTTYSDPVNPKYTDFSKTPPVNRLVYRIQDTINVGRNCNYSMDSLPQHWYTPGQERCYAVKLILYDPGSGCDDSDQVTLALMGPNVKNAVDIQFLGKQCADNGNSDRKVLIVWDRDEPKCSNQFVWINFDSACGANLFVPQTAFNPLIFSPVSNAYGCSYKGNTSFGSSTVPFSQEGHIFPKSYTRQYTSFCDPSGKITMGIVVQNGCDSAIISLTDSLWMYWTGCEWNQCAFSNAAQKTVCRNAYPNSFSFPAFAKHDDSRIINYYTPAQKATALAALPGGLAVCYACRDTAWFHDAIQYHELKSNQDSGSSNKPKYCTGESDQFCPQASVQRQENVLAVSWNFYLSDPGKPGYKLSPPDTTYTIVDSIYRFPTYKRLRWNISQYLTNGNSVQSMSGPFDMTVSFQRDTIVDTSFCYKQVGSVVTKVITKITKAIRDSLPCTSFRFTASGKWRVSFTVVNVDSCEYKSSRDIIVGNKLKLTMNDTIFGVGGNVKPKATIKYWMINPPAPPQSQYDPRDYWNDKIRNPGTNAKEEYLFDWGDGGSFVKVDTTVIASCTHVYNAAGNYTFKIAWKDSNNCMDTMVYKDLIHVIKVHAAFTAERKSVCDREVQFLDSSWVENRFSNTSKDSILALSWSFGDGTFEYYNKNPMHTYYKNGTYSVALWVFTAPGYIGQVTHEVQISGPDPEFELMSGSATTGCVPFKASIAFTNSSDTTFRIVTINWGDGKSQTLTKSTSADPFPFPQIDHVYLNAGDFCITMTALDTIMDEHGQPVVCSRNYPESAFNPACIKSVSNTPAQFTAPDSVGTGQLVVVTSNDWTFYDTFTWNFGDGSPDTSVYKPGFQAIHRYLSPGTYTITYKSSNQYCSGTTTKKIAVRNKTGLVESDRQDEFMIFPNPAHGSFYYQAGYMDQGTLKLTITNMEGKVIMEQKLKTLRGEISLNCPPGMYFVTLNNGTKIYAAKLAVE